MLGGNVQTIKRIGIRSGMFNIFSRNEYDLDPGFAHISPVKDGEDTIGYSQTVQYLAGVIEDVQIQRRTRKIGGQPKPLDYIDIYLNSGGTNIVIELTFDSGPGKSFAATFRNLIPYLGNVVCIKAYQLTPAAGQENGRQGVLLYPNTVTPILQKASHIPSYYVSAKTEIAAGRVEGRDYFVIPNFEKPGRTGAMEYDKDAASNWLYTQFREDVYSVFRHYELDEQIPSAQQQYQQAPPPPQNNYYANAPQHDYQNNHAAPPPPPQQHYQAPPPPPARPERIETPNIPAQNYSQPINETIVPPAPPPPPERVYKSREAAPVTYAAPQPPHIHNPVQSNNPNAGMTGGGGVDFDEIPF